MAKKKAASPAATHSPTPSRTVSTKSTAKKSTAPKSASNGDASTAEGVLGHDQIGMAAGAVWLLLTDKGETTLTTIKKEVDAPAELILAAVGWLAREDKLDFTVSGKTVKLALK